MKDQDLPIDVKLAMGNYVMEFEKLLKLPTTQMLLRNSRTREGFCMQFSLSPEYTIDFFVRVCLYFEAKMSLAGDWISNSEMTEEAIKTINENKDNPNIRAAFSKILNIMKINPAMMAKIDPKFFEDLDMGMVPPDPEKT